MEARAKPFCFIESHCREWTGRVYTNRREPLGCDWLMRRVSFLMVIYLNRDIPFWPCRSSHHTHGGDREVWLPLCLRTVCFCASGVVHTSLHGTDGGTSNGYGRISHAHGRDHTARWCTGNIATGITTLPSNFSNAESKHRIFLMTLWLDYCGLSAGLYREALRCWHGCQKVEIWLNINLCGSLGLLRDAFEYRGYV